MKGLSVRSAVTGFYRVLPSFTEFYRVFLLIEMEQVRSFATVLVSSFPTFGKSIFFSSFVSLFMAIRLYLLGFTGFSADGFTVPLFFFLVGLARHSTRPKKNRPLRFGPFFRDFITFTEFYWVSNLFLTEWR